MGLITSQDILYGNGLQSPTVQKEHTLDQIACGGNTPILSIGHGQPIIEGLDLVLEHDPFLLEAGRRVQ